MVGYSHAIEYPQMKTDRTGQLGTLGMFIGNKGLASLSPGRNSSCMSKGQVIVQVLSSTLSQNESHQLFATYNVIVLLLKR